MARPESDAPPGGLSGSAMPGPAASVRDGRIEVLDDCDGRRPRLVLSGVLRLSDLPALEDALARVAGRGDPALDLTSLSRIDTSVAWLLSQRLPAASAAPETGADPHVRQAFEIVRRHASAVDAAGSTPHRPLLWLEAVGRAIVELARLLLSLLDVLGLFVARLMRAARHPARLRLTALVSHCDDVGLRAIPIVALMSFLIGVVLAYQGAAQLARFGANLYVVDLIAISVLRELGVLLTAIIVAGRTSSAFTAAIGAMKLRQEIDAMQVIGVDPGDALVVPRILALLVTLPILTLIANLSGLVGGALMSWVELGLSPQVFVERLSQEIPVGHVAAGLVKAPVFALLIGVIGCQGGLAVSGTAESLGRRTSASVVISLFAVILADAGFSVVFQRIVL